MFETLDCTTASLGAGFGGPITPRDARRQWSLSLVVVVALGIAILSALASFGIRPMAVRADPVIAAGRLMMNPEVAARPDRETLRYPPSQS